MNSSIFSFLFVILTGTLGLDEECTKNSDCSTANSVCINGTCACDDLSYYSEQSQKCLQYVTEYNSVCYEDAQCEFLVDNFKCRNNRCICQESYRWYQGKCQKYVKKGGQCESKNECYTGYDLLSLTCSSGKCDCSNNYYNRGNDCRKSSFVLGDCALDLDCQSSFLECVLGKCSLKNNSSQEIYLEVDIDPVASTISTINYGQEEIPCESDGDCGDMANSICDISNKKCGCNEYTHYLYNGNCVQGLSRCEDTTDCNNNNTMCFKNSCICQNGFFLKDGQCIAELGMLNPHVVYETDGDCPIKPGQLIDQVCYCKNYWFNDDSNRNCIKTMTQSTQTCLTNEWCHAMGPYAFCNSTTNKCQCNSVAEFNETTYYCDFISDSDEIDICLNDSDCGINERCLDENCHCLENYSRNNKTICVPNIGASCAIESCSHIENAYCLGGICVCGNEYIGKETVCLKMAESLGAPCEAQEQCQNIKFAVCGEPDAEYETAENQTLQCICDEGYTDVNNMCYQIKKYGDPCMTEAECTMVLNRSYKCRNSQCQCGVGLSLKNGYCTSSSSTVLAGSLVWLALLIRLSLC